MGLIRYLVNLNTLGFPARACLAFARIIAIIRSGASMPNVRTLTRLACLVACADLLGVSAQIAQKCNLDISPRPRQDQTLKLIKRSWASHSLVSEVAAILLEEVLMYDVERVYPDTTPAQDIRSLSLGEADVNFEVWQGGKERELHTWVRNGSAVIAGSHAMVSFDGMYTLRHTIERFPEARRQQMFKQPSNCI